MPGITVIIRNSFEKENMNNLQLMIDSMMHEMIYSGKRDAGKKVNNSLAIASYGQL